MSRLNRFLVTLFLSFSIYCVSFAGCNYAPSIVWLFLEDPDSSGTDATNAKWRQLPIPPVGVKEIIAADYFTVYVITEDGRKLGCYRESKLDSRCWFEIDQLPELKADWDCEWCLFPEPPEGIVVIQEFQIDYHEGREDRSAFSYILDGNGQVWQWGFERVLYFGPPKVSRINFRASVCGCVTGMLFPLILIIIMWRRELGNYFSRR